MIFSKFGFGKTSNRRFNYIPRYYNAEKEELQERVRRAKEEINETNYADRIRNGFKHRTNAYNTVKNPLSMSSVRVLLIAIILGSIFYLMFNGGLIDRFFLFFAK